MGSKLLQKIGGFIARMPGLPILIAVVLVMINFALQLLPDWPVVGWLAHKNVFLHLAVILGFVGLLLGDAL